MTRADLAEFDPEWVEPITTNYHGYDVFQLPPPGQGFAALEMLNILEVCVPRLGSTWPTSARATRVLAPAGRSEEARLRRPARVQRRPAVRDGPGRGAPLEGVRGDAVRSDRPEPAPPAGRAAAPRAGRSTSTTADRWGNMVSLIHSVFSVYGSRATVAPYGFVLHNRGARLLARSRPARTSSRRASGRSTRSSPASS